MWDVLLFACLDKDGKYRNTNIHEFWQKCIHIHSYWHVLWGPAGTGIFYWFYRFLCSWYIRNLVIFPFCRLQSLLKHQHYKYHTSCQRVTWVILTLCFLCFNECEFGNKKLRMLSKPNGATEDDFSSFFPNAKNLAVAASKYFTHSWLGCDFVVQSMDSNSLKIAIALFGPKIVILFVPMDQPIAKFLNFLFNYLI